MVRMGTDTDGAYSASASSSTLPLHSSPTRVSLVGSRPTSKARGTRLRPVTSDYIKTKSRSKTPKAVHKTPFTKDTRSTNELSKGVYPSNFMKKLRHPEMLRGDEKLTHALTKSTSDSTLLHSVDDSVFERFMDAKLKERGLKDSASFVGVFAGLDANADADGLPTSVFESTANDGSQVYQSGPLQHQVGTSFAYQQHINSLMKEYQKSLTEQVSAAITINAHLNLRCHNPRCHNPRYHHITRMRNELPKIRHKRREHATTFVHTAASCPLTQSSYLRPRSSPATLSRCR